MTDLNTAICKARGWTNISVLKNGETCATSPDGCFYCPAPDYEHDARLYMALFEEMPDECFIQKINNRLYSVGKIEGMGVKTFSRNSDLGTAICQAYVKLKGIEVVG